MQMLVRGDPHCRVLCKEDSPDYPPLFDQRRGIHQQPWASVKFRYLERTALTIQRGLKVRVYPAPGSWRKNFRQISSNQPFRRGPLQWHPLLARTARLHANDMLERRYVAHITPEGTTVANRLDRQGISYLACGENIGVIYGPASHGERGIQEVQAAFMNQPRRLTNHRGNILNPVWTHVGIGIAYAPEGQLIVTQNFIATLTKPV